MWKSVYKLPSVDIAITLHMHALYITIVPPYSLDMI